MTAIPVAIKTYREDTEKEHEDATRSEKFLEEACMLNLYSRHIPYLVFMLTL